MLWWWSAIINSGETTSKCMYVYVLRVYRNNVKNWCQIKETEFLFRQIAPDLVDAITHTLTQKERNLRSSVGIASAQS